MTRVVISGRVGIRGISAYFSITPEFVNPMKIKRPLAYANRVPDGSYLIEQIIELVSRVNKFMILLLVSKPLLDGFMLGLYG